MKDLPARLLFVKFLAFMDFARVLTLAIVKEPDTVVLFVKFLFALVDVQMEVFVYCPKPAIALLLLDGTEQIAISQYAPFLVKTMQLAVVLILANASQDIKVLSARTMKMSAKETLLLALH